MEHAASPRPDRAPGLETAAVQPRAGKQPPAAAGRELYIAFYREYIAKLVAYLVFLGADFRDAADLAQETMIDVYRSWSEIEFPRAWSKRVAARKYARRLTAVKEETVLIAETESPLLPPGLNVAEWEERHEVLRKLAELPIRQRQVMALILDGYTAAEIAGELGLSIDAVRANLMRARRALAAKLGGPEWVSDD